MPNLGKTWVLDQCEQMHLPIQTEIFPTRLNQVQNLDLVDSITMTRFKYFLLDNTPQGYLF